MIDRLENNANSFCSQIYESNIKGEYLRGISSNVILFSKFLICWRNAQVFTHRVVFLSFYQFTFVFCYCLVSSVSFQEARLVSIVVFFPLMKLTQNKNVKSFTALIFIHVSRYEQVFQIYV